MNWWVLSLWEASPVILVAWVFWVIASITLHELGHGWAALRLGDTTPADTGHMTLNPIVHLGPQNLVFFLLLGYTGGAMPVDPTRLRGRYGEALVAAAGPAVNVLLALTAFALFFLWTAIAGGYWISGAQVHQPLYGNTRLFLLWGMVANIALLLFNLLPVPPLDGSRILGCIHRPYARLWMGENSQWVGLILFVVLFTFAGRYVFGAGAEVAFAANEWTMRVLTP